MVRRKVTDIRVFTNTEKSRAHKAKDCPNCPAGNQTGNMVRDGETTPLTAMSGGGTPMGAVHTAMTGLVLHAADF